MIREHNTITHPMFVTLTGADKTDYIPPMQALSATYNGQIEWGILISQDKQGTPLFPVWEVIDAFRISKLHLSAHICGTLAEDIFAGRDIRFDFSGFRRIQINKFHQHSNSEEIENAITFGRKHGIRTILQCGYDVPMDTRTDWLIDTSFGQGKLLKTVPSFQKTNAFCGISGGLSADNIQNILKDSAKKTHNRSYWIDVESSLCVRSQFNLTACANFVAKVFPPNTP